jgi:hypothetical protein
MKLPYQTIDVPLPIRRSALLRWPAVNEEILHPNEILDDILLNTSMAARKVYYCILAEDHNGDRETREYAVPYTSVHKRSKDNSRGKAIRDAVREEFQHRSFRVHPKFVRTYLKKNYSEDPHISPFSMVDFVKGNWLITLTPEFKLYLSVFQEMHEKSFSFTKGDLSLLTGFTHPHTDKIYWLIRREQWVRDSKVLDVEVLKELLDKRGADTHNVLRQSLYKIKRELAGTWAEFDYAPVKKGQGAKVKSVRLTFRKSGDLLDSLHDDLRFEYEFTLLRYGVDPRYITSIRMLILNKASVKGSNVPWCSEYVLHTVGMVLNEYKKGKVKSLTQFISRALWEGYYADTPKLIDWAEKYAPDAGGFGKQVNPGITASAEVVFLDAVDALYPGVSNWEEFTLLQTGEPHKLSRVGKDGRAYLIPQREIDRLSGYP